MVDLDTTSFCDNVIRGKNASYNISGGGGGPVNSMLDL